MSIERTMKEAVQFSYIFIINFMSLAKISTLANPAHHNATNHTH